MKATAIRQTVPPVFEPVEITIKIDNQKELDAMGALFNYTPIIEALNELGCPDTKLWRQLSKLGAETDILVFSKALKKHMI